MKYSKNHILPGFLLFLSLVLSSTLDGQSAMPGGVLGLKHWYSLSETSPAGWEWSDKINKLAPSVPVAQDQVSYINGNPALKLDKQQTSMDLSLDATALDRSTIISLYQAQDTFHEQIIWRINAASKADLVLSTARLGDVSRGRYFNNPGPAGLHPILHTYFQHDRSKAGTTSLQWHIGHLGDKENLPLVPFEGVLAELLVFDRVLSEEELKRVHTHLAIQYGISLPFTDYLSASGEVIWDQKEHEDFPYRITGIMHDPVSGLHQRRSRTHMSTDKLIELSAGAWTSTNAANEQALIAGASLVWSDNGERLRFLPADAERGTAPILERKWLMDVGPGGHEISTSLRLHTRNLEKIVQAGQEVWLAVDHSGSGDFAYADTEYYPATKEEELLVFKDVHWDQDQSGKDVFSFLLGEPMIPLMGIEQPQCNPGQAAKLALKVYGGVAPYKVSWMNTETNNPQFWTLDAGEELIWSAEETGYFELRLKDAEGQSLHRKVNLQNHDAPMIDLLPRYTLSSTNSLTVHLGDDFSTDASVEWTRPDGSTTGGLTLNADESGEYKVRVEANGCARAQYFEVLPPPDSFLEEWQLFPNPVAPNERFDLRISLRESQQLEIRLLDQNGRLLSTEKRAAAAFHSYRNRLPVAGLYQLVLQNGSEQISLPIVVQ